MTWSRLIAFLGASWSTGTSQGAESHWSYIPCVPIHLKRLIVEAGFWALTTVLVFNLVLLQLSPSPLCSCFCFYLSFLDFFKTTRPKLSLLPVFVLQLGWRWNTWIAQPWSTGDTLPPPAQRWTGLGPTMLLWLKMGGVGFHPAMCLACFLYPCCWDTII